MLKASVLVFLFLSAVPVATQAPNPATYIPAADIQAFINALPRDAITDRAIRVVDMGGHKVGVYGVYRPKTSKQEAVLHETKMSELYYMLTGAGTLVTGGTLANPTRQTAGLTGITVRGDRIEGGVTRRVSPGDIVVIPGRTPHWWSSLEGDISYLIVRSDPEGTQALK
jgi:mannose-6-phosphate isomerase-like protein (cupin superfamily)